MAQRPVWFRPAEAVELDGGIIKTYVVGTRGVTNIHHLAGTVTVDFENGRTVVHTPVGVILMEPVAKTAAPPTERTEVAERGRRK